jgi:Rap1a immunity proteins
MIRMLLVLCALTVELVLTSPAWATDHSANYYLPGCRDFANKTFSTDPFLQGECVGILEGLSVFASDLDPRPGYHMFSRSCPPDNATLAQIATVVVRWFDQHPERWHEDFRADALFALHDAWPCPTGD